MCYRRYIQHSFGADFVFNMHVVLLVQKITTYTDFLGYLSAVNAPEFMDTLVEVTPLLG